MQKKNYLSNRELLKEIHKSKMSFCYIIDQKYYDYDVIIEDLSQITDEIIEEAKKNRAKRIAYNNWENAVLKWEKTDNRKHTKPKLMDYDINPDTIQTNDLVIRLMTYDHVPLDNRKANPKTTADKHVKCNFPPFKHYGYINEKWTEVVRSHWDGGLDNGQFSLISGKITNKLGFMMIKLVERYSMKSNWRNYSYVDEMRGQSLLQLTQFGLYFDESKSNNPFAYYTSTLGNSFTGYLNMEKKNQNLRDDLLQDAGYMPSYTRQLNDELAQQTARDEYDKKITEEQKDFDINV